jgi:hypothetical protein
MHGDIDRAAMWLDEVEAVFVRLPIVLDANLLAKLAGTYKTPLGMKVSVKLNRDGDLLLSRQSEPADVLKPLSGLQFRSTELPDVTFEFILKDGRVTSLRHWDAHAEFEWARIADSEEPVWADD